MGEKTNRTKELFNSRYGCAQSVVAAFSETYGLSTETALKIACVFGGGCQSAELCGAVSGASIIIGLKYGQYIEGDMDTRANCNEHAARFLDAFRSEFGSIICRDLLGFDLTTPEGKEQYSAMVRAKSPCAGFVRRAAELLEEFGY